MIWFVHRRADNSIASAHGDKQPGYAEEALDDASNAEIQAFRAAVTASPIPTEKEKLEAATGMTLTQIKAVLAGGK